MSLVLCDRPRVPDTVNLGATFCPEENDNITFLRTAGSPHMCSWVDCSYLMRDRCSVGNCGINHTRACSGSASQSRKSQNAAELWRCPGVRTKSRSWFLCIHNKMWSSTVVFSLSGRLQRHLLITSVHKLLGLLLKVEPMLRHSSVVFFVAL